MTDREILKRRADLVKRSREIQEEWQAYDKRYPVIVGAYKPSDYDRQQIGFVERLQELRAEASALPATKASKVKRALIIVALIAVAAFAAWKALS